MRRPQLDQPCHASWPGIRIELDQRLPGSLPTVQLLLQPIKVGWQRRLRLTQHERGLLEPDQPQLEAWIVSFHSDGRGATLGCSWLREVG